MSNPLAAVLLEQNPIVRYDLFTRADSTTSLGTPTDGGTGYTLLNSTWGIGTNQARVVSVDSTSYSFALLQTSRTAVSMSITTNHTSNLFGIVARYSDVNNHFKIYSPSGTSIAIVKSVGGAQSAVVTDTSSIPAGAYTLRVDINSSNLISVFVDEKLITSVTDSALASNTMWGMYAAASSLRLDNLIITALP